MSANSVAFSSERDPTALTVMLLAIKSLVNAAAMPPSPNTPQRNPVMLLPSNVGNLIALCQQDFRYHHNPTAGKDRCLRGCQKLVDEQQPPLRLVLGSTTIPTFKAAYEQRLQIWNEWAELSERAQGKPSALAT
ncbi:hypothetical protein [Devosia sp. UYZn731]|uniref:hypothetical protein n=1 Tax=Devosia sp. UYZn731 TaxID=3156345 RepID=UPI00339269AA